VTADDSTEENSMREVGNCVMGSRIRNPVPPLTAKEDMLGGSGKTKESVVRWSAVSKFSEGRSRFYPGFSKTDNIRIVGVDEI